MTLQKRYNLPPSDALAAFCAVMELGSQNAAARVLNVTQPALSSRISKLESWAGVGLFDGRAPTFDAIALYGKAKQFLGTDWLLRSDRVA